MLLKRFLVDIIYKRFVNSHCYTMISGMASARVPFFVWSVYMDNVIMICLFFVK